MAGTENLSFNLTGPFTANAAIRFVATSFENGFLGIGSDVVQIDNVTVDFFRPAPAPTVNYATTFTEDQNDGGDRQQSRHRRGQRQNGVGSDRADQCPGR